MIELGRRSLIKGLVALVATPAIVKASSLIACAPTETLTGIDWAAGDDLTGVEINTKYTNSILTLQQITREAVKNFCNSNEFIKSLDGQYDRAFAEGHIGTIGDVLRIRLPRDFIVSDGPALSAQDITPGSTWIVKPEAPQLPAPLAVAALAVAAAPVVEEALKKPVTRRFWS